MGDHRAGIKIKMEFHGIKDDTDMWINYSPHSCCNMDERVIEFFNSVYERGMVKYNELMAKAFAKDNKEKIEQEEKAELKRLKKKYESNVAK
jgi:hypothetical protein